MRRFDLVRKGLQDLVGAQLVFGHGDRSGSHTQLTDNIQISSPLTSRTIAESYDEAIIPLGWNISIDSNSYLRLFQHRMSNFEKDM